MPQLHNRTLNLYYLFYKVRRKLSEISASFWTDLEIFSALNEAQQIIAKKSKCLKKTVTVTTVVNTAEYDLKDNSFADIIAIDKKGVYFYVNGSVYTPLEYRTYEQLNAEFPGWQGAAASTPMYFYYDKSLKTLGLYPKPNSSNAGAYLFVGGYRSPKILLGGQASSGSTSTIVFPAGSSTVPYPSPTDDYYNNLWIEIYSGTGAGQLVEITDYTASTRTASATFATAPDSTSLFGMVPEIPEEAQDAMYSFAMGDLLEKGGSRTVLSDRYKNEFGNKLAGFIGDFIEEDDEEIVKDTYRG